MQFTTCSALPIFLEDKSRYEICLYIISFVQLLWQATYKNLQVKIKFSLINYYLMDLTFIKNLYIFHRLRKIFDRKLLLLSVTKISRHKFFFDRFYKNNYNHTFLNFNINRWNVWLNIIKTWQYVKFHCWIHFFFEIIIRHD